LKSEFALHILDRKIGKAEFWWDEVTCSVTARVGSGIDGMCKLWLLGRQGRMLLGTMIPEAEGVGLHRRFSVRQVERCGAWPAEGVAVTLVWPFEPERPFPRPELFCFGKVEENRLWISFDAQGNPVMPE